MNAIPRLRRYHYLVRVSIFLIAVALIAGMISCDGEYYSYTVTITSTAGGSVAIPGEGDFTYYEGTIVNLVATPDAGYHFVEWTGDVVYVDNVNAVTTNITMNYNFSITANFAPGIPVRDWYDLDAIRDDLDVNYILMNDLDSTTAGYAELASPTANSGKGWQPIGSWHEPDDAFTGTFDGQGCEILDLFINRPDESYVGLFCLIYSETIIENVGVVGADVTGDASVGALIGANGATMSDSYSTGSVCGDRSVGGLVGGNTGNVTGSYSTASVCAGDTAGGLVGWNHYGTVSNSYSTGGVSGNYSLGGLVGWNDYGTVSNSYSTGTVSGDYSLGGLVGLDEFDATVMNSFWDTETSGQASSDSGTGKNTTEMQDIATFSGVAWDIIAVDNANDRDTGYIWNIVNDDTYPFLSWQPVS